MLYAKKYTSLVVKTLSFYKCYEILLQRHNIYKDSTVEEGNKLVTRPVGQLPANPPNTPALCGTGPAPPLIFASLLPSTGIILTCSFSPSSHLPSSFLNLCSSTPHLKSRSAIEHLLSPPIFVVAALCSLLHSKSTHLFFTFLCTFFSCIDLSICPTFVCCFNSIICY
jgi:hypothetical protein